MDVSILEQLEQLGADQTKHVHGSLLAHLKGTHDLLQEWGARPALCNAGLYHSVYGTADFRTSLIPMQDRQKVAALIGKESEQIVYLFSACDRDYVYSRLRESGTLDYRDRYSSVSCSLPPERVADLCELTVANELEIARWQPRQFLRDHPDLARALARMKPFVSEHGARMFDQILGEVAD